MQNRIRCDVCGRFVSFAAINSGEAVHRLITPLSDFSCEEYETLCKKHASWELSTMRELR